MVLPQGGRCFKPGGASYGRPHAQFACPGDFPGVLYEDAFLRMSPHLSRHPLAAATGITGKRKPGSGLRNRYAREFATRSGNARTWSTKLAPRLPNYFIVLEFAPYHYVWCLQWRTDCVESGACYLNIECKRMAGRRIRPIRGAARFGQSRHGIRTALVDAGSGIWSLRKLWAGGRVSQRVGTLRMGPQKMSLFPTYQGKTWLITRPFRSWARIGASLETSNAATSRGIPLRPVERGRPRNPPPPEGGKSRRRMAADGMARRLRKSATGAGFISTISDGDIAHAG